MRCRKGLRLHGAVSDKVRDELCFILERCGIRTIAERPGSHRQMTSFRQREGPFFLKTPDLVLPDLDAPRAFTIVDIKIVDPAAASYVKQYDLKICSSPAPSPGDCRPSRLIWTIPRAPPLSLA